MGQASLLTPQERGRAVAALARLAAAERHENGHFDQVSRREASEDQSMSVEVQVHDGPLGSGRTLIVEKQVGNILVRKMVGDTPYGVTRDWYEINLNNIITPH